MHPVTNIKQKDENGRFSLKNWKHNLKSIKKFIKMAFVVPGYGILTQDNDKKVTKKRKWDFRKDSYNAPSRNQVEIIWTHKTKHWLTK